MQGFEDTSFDRATLSAAFGAVQQGVAYYDREDRLRFWNLAYERFWTDHHGVTLACGDTYAEILQGMLDAGAYPEAAGREADWMAERLANRSKDWHSFERKNTQGCWRRMEQTRTPDGGLMCISVDITALKQTSAALEQALQAAQAATEAKSAFLATMSHEIRTPLNGVLGMAQAMSADALPNIQRERLDVIRQSGETLLAILNDILDISKIEAGKLELEDAVFDISELAKGAYAAFTALANKKGLSFALSIKPGAEGAYRGDSTRIRQILYNLISNGLKFTTAGEVRVAASYGADGLTLAVSDTGIGISPDAQRRLFEKFVQADSSTTRQFGGSGLGLSICRELTHLMGGRISVVSAPDRGSVFTVVLPLEKLSHAAPTISLSHFVDEGHDDALDLPPLRVLAAEDNEINRLVLKTVLHQIGVDPVIVHDGIEAVAAWEREAFDVILMDVQMPQMDGPTAARAVRRREAETGRARTPIIALTANVMAHQIEGYRQSGMDGFVAKPIQMDDLIFSLQAALEGEPLQAA